MSSLPGESLRQKIETVLMVAVLDLGDTNREIAKIFDSVRKALARDSRFPRLTPRQFDLMLVKRDAEIALEPYTQIDWLEAADAIVAALADHVAKEAAPSKLKSEALLRTKEDAP